MEPIGRVQPVPAQPLTHLVQLGLVTWEGEGEAKGEFLVFDLQFIQEVGQTLSNVVEKLEKR